MQAPPPPAGRPGHARAAARVAAIVLLLGARPVAAAPDCFDAGLAALDAQRYAEAAAAFDRATRQPACAADAVDLRFNMGFALQQLAQTGDADAACRAVSAYREVAAMTTDPDLVGTARGRIAALEPRCPSPAPPASGSDWPMRSAIAAGVVAVATGVAYGLALDADGDRADARAAYVTLRMAGDREGADAAAARFADARDRTDGLAITAYVGLGLTVALTGLFVGGLIFGDGEQSASVILGPAGVGLSGAW